MAFLGKLDPWLEPFFKTFLTFFPLSKLFVSALFRLKSEMVNYFQGENYMIHGMKQAKVRSSIFKID